MGDIADDIISGFICQYCCCPMEDGEEPGHPRTCNECLDEELEERMADRYWRERADEYNEDDDYD